MPTAFGTVHLAGIQLDLDPENLTILGGQRRGSIHKLVDGTTEFQDRGFDISDARIELSGSFINAATYASLVAAYTAAAGTQMVWTDFKGNNAMVLFLPGDRSFEVTIPRGSDREFRYTIKLAVVSATTWNGQTNPG